VRPTILVVEDSDLTRSMITATFAEAGYRVLEAANGRDGLDLFTREEVDLIVTDLEMPLVDGYGVLAGVRGSETRSDTPVVVFTTREDEAEKRRAAQAGADVYLLKAAFDQEAVLATIAQLLAAREETAP
jgi:CheY-like chemotaxis protein